MKCLRLSFITSMDLKDQQRYDNGVPEFDLQQPDEAMNEELPIPVDQPVVPHHSTRVNFGILSMRLIAD